MIMSNNINKFILNDIEIPVIILNSGVYWTIKIHSGIKLKWKNGNNKLDECFV